MRSATFPATVLMCGAMFGLPSNRARAQAPSSSVQGKPELRRLVGAIGADGIEHTIRALVGFGTRNTLSSQADPKRGIGAARDWVYSEFLKLRDVSGGRLQVEKQTFLQPVASRIPQPTSLTNLVAILPGDLPADRQRYVVVSGHYDSICTDPTDADHDAPGANDDGSGTAAVLAMARAMVPYHYHATLVFLVVAGEEQGLYGSAYFAEQAKQAHWRIEAMLDNDIIGSSHGANGEHDDRSVRLFSEGVPTDETQAQAALRRSVGGENDGPSRQLARFIKEVGERAVPGMRVDLIYRRDRYLRGGDHIPFLERGYPAVRFTEPHEDYRHQHQNVRVENGVQYGDLPEFVDFRYVAQVARVNAAALATLALAPDVPADAGIVTRRLTNDTELRWSANQDPNLAGYEVVWRATTAPTWTHHRFVGKVTNYVFPGLSKDDFFFGVRAVDRAGHASPVAFPRPMR
jgi:hypothetical protein